MTGWRPPTSPAASCCCASNRPSWLAIADALGHTQVARLLRKTVYEESAADTNLTWIAEREVLPAAKEAELAEVGAGSEEA